MPPPGCEVVCLDPYDGLEDSGSLLEYDANPWRDFFRDDDVGFEYKDPS